MPSYDYVCVACNNSWEEEQRITEEALKVCPKCGKEKAKRLISGGVGFILEGGGWANEGYSKK